LPSEKDSHTLRNSSLALADACPLRKYSLMVLTSVVEPCLASHRPGSPGIASPCHGTFPRSAGPWYKGVRRGERKYRLLEPSAVVHPAERLESRDEQTDFLLLLVVKSLSFGNGDPTLLLGDDGI